MGKKDRQHLGLLCDISELAAILSGSENVRVFLQKAVELVGRHLHADVSSIYLLDEATQELVLEATRGLNQDAVGNIRLEIGEGLVGKTLDTLKPLKVGSAGSHPGFKYFEAAGEDDLNSFLAVPILRGEEKIGVLVVQHRSRSYFGQTDILAMRAIASQLAGAVGNARLVSSHPRLREQFAQPPTIPKHLDFTKGEPVSRGHAFAPISIFEKRRGTPTAIRSDKDSGHSLKDFHNALRASGEQIEDLQNRFSHRLPESASLIFTAHTMILKDGRFAGEMEKLIKDGVPAPEAISRITQHWVDLYSSSPNPYTREKAYDVRDLADRILRNLANDLETDPNFNENRIVIASELFPSDVLKLASEEIKGIILVGGGVAAHVSILARSLKIPMIITDRSEFTQLPERTPVLMDAEGGGIYVQPSEDIILEYEARVQADQRSEIPSEEVSTTSLTRDGTRIRLLANVNLLSDLVLAREFKTEGIGLYRSEFPFLLRSALPSEEEQYVIYRRIFDGMLGRPVTIRTLDLGGDKQMMYFGTGSEENPALGMRATRFMLHYREIFNQQVRAILRSAAGVENPRIMFPMIASIEEFYDAKQVVSDCMQVLDQQGLPYHQAPLIGVLLEVPAVIEIIDDLVAASDFLCIGTNDFVQYMLAADRGNRWVKKYYRPDHPAVLRGIARISEAAGHQKKEISVCGEMAHEPAFIPFFLGIGIRILSIYPSFLPDIQKMMGELTISDAKSYADRLLAESTLEGIHQVQKTFFMAHNLYRRRFD